MATCVGIQLTDRRYLIATKLSIKLQINADELNRRDLSSDTLTAVVVKPDGSSATGTVTARSPQTGDDKGVADLVIEAVELDQDGTWSADIFLNDGGGAEFVDRLTFGVCAAL